MVWTRPARIVVGIGNPGPEYEGTRHNLGFEAVALAAQRLGLVLSGPTGFLGLWGSTRRFGRSCWARGGSGQDSFLLLQPLTYVNLTGRTVAQAAAWAGVPPEAIFVVSDDLNLPPGQLRIRHRGSDGGHKGLRSVGACLGTNRFPRLRMGIGPAPGDVTEHVLGRFTPTERILIDEQVDRAAAAVVDFTTGRTLNELMNGYNRG